MKIKEFIVIIGLFILSCSTSEKLELNINCLDCYSVEDPFNHRVHCKDTIENQIKYSICYGVEGEVVNDNFGVAIYTFKYDSINNKLIEVEYYNEEKEKTQNIEGVSVIKYKYLDKDSSQQEFKYNLDGELVE